MAVAIVAVLAAVAIPSFVEMQYRSKIAEVPVVSDGLLVEIDALAIEGVAQVDSFNENCGDTTPSCPNTPGKASQPMLDGCTDRTCFDSFVGFNPDGDVRGRYSLILYDGAMVGLMGCQIDAGGSVRGAVAAETDVDGDGLHRWWYDTRTDSPSNVIGWCPATLARY